MSQEALKPLITQIQAVAAAQPDPARFLKDLQAEIEHIPGANVAFASRDLSWLESYMEDRGEVSQDDRQAALVSASAQYDENYASQDGISYEMDAYLNKHHPAQEEGIEP